MKEKVTTLFLLYGELLTENIKRRMDMFYLQDFSLSEIAQIEKVSRNAVYESLLGGVKHLQEYEEKLGFSKRLDRIFKKVDELEHCVDENVRELIEEIKGELNHGI